MRAIRPSWAAIFSGILIGTSYIPFPPWAIFFCLIPIWSKWLDDPRPKRVFFEGWVTQFLLTLIGFNWIAYTAVEFGHLPWPLGILTLIGFCCLFHLHVPFSGWVWAQIQKRIPMSRLASVVFLAASFALFEAVWPMIFPWNIGYTWLWAKFPAYQWADVVGFQGLSAITAFLNVPLFFAWENRRNLKKCAIYAGISIGVFALLNLTALHRADRWRETDSKVKILAIQANIGNLEKYWQDKGNMFLDAITKKYISVATRGLQTNPSPDFLTFPETAIPINLDSPFSSHYLYQDFMSFIKTYKIPLIVGAYSQNADAVKVYNGIFLFDGEGNYKDVYRKSILLAFGEYFPGAETFPILKKLVPAISDFGAGPGPSVLDHNGLKMGPQVCYEGLYPSHSRGLAALGTEIFINATNDSWYGTYAEPYQHLYMTFGRAIEFRRPLMRTTNTGITTAISADGTIHDFSPFNTEWTHQFELPYIKNPPQTLFEKVGQHLPVVLLFLMSLTLFSGYRASIHERGVARKKGQRHSEGSKT